MKEKHHGKILAWMGVGCSGDRPGDHLFFLALSNQRGRFLPVLPPLIAVRQK